MKTPTWNRLIAAAAALLLVAVALESTAAATIHVRTLPGGWKYRTLRSTGPSALRYDVVIVGDGWQSGELSTFAQRADDLVNSILSTEPYSARPMAFNFWRVDVISKDSGADHPKHGTTASTELDCTFSNTTDERELSCDATKVTEAAAYAPDADLVVVIVNDSTYGGLAWDNVFAVSTDPQLKTIATHELGHKLGLADEYPCRACDGSDSGRPWPGGEPGSPNLTSFGTRQTAKWSSVIDAVTPIPTSVDNPAGVVGLWSGGGYYATGIYHPQAACHMNTLPPGFCRVCGAALTKKLNKHVTRCENPDALSVRPCFDARVLALLRRQDLDWAIARHVRWPIPLPCTRCGRDRPFGPDEYVLTLDGLPAGAELVALDENGAALARTATQQGPVTLSFRAPPGQRVAVEVSVADGDKRELPRSVVAARLVRAGVEQELPSE